MSRSLNVFLDAQMGTFNLSEEAMEMTPIDYVTNLDGIDSVNIASVNSCKDYDDEGSYTFVIPDGWTFYNLDNVEHKSFGGEIEIEIIRACCCQQKYERYPDRIDMPDHAVLYKCNSCEEYLVAYAEEFGKPSSFSFSAGIGKEELVSLLLRMDIKELCEEVAGKTPEETLACILSKSQ
ncbi:hypothetical protein BX667DRAFT_505308 [Coemansia mojavensis]|nr:hypothetical protein BX667DRAFT_505308 [Coemansia mojavensis]